MDYFVHSVKQVTMYKISIVVNTMSISIILYLHQDRLRQLLSVDYFDCYLLTSNTMDPELDQS